MLFCSCPHAAGNNHVHSLSVIIERLGDRRTEAMPRHHQQGFLLRWVQSNQGNSFSWPCKLFKNTTLFFRCKDLSPPLKSGVTSPDEAEN